MKKFFLLAIASLMALSGTALADTGYVTIGTGTSGSYNYPYGNNYNYSTTQSIYTATEIGTGGTIKTLAYNVAQAGSLSTTSVQIYMGHTSKSSLRSSSDEENVSNMTLVYSGSPTLATKTGWEELTLTTPFAYNGTDNLVIVVGRQSNSYNGSAVYYCSNTSSNQCLYRRSKDDSSYGDPSTTGGYSTIPQHANVRLGFEGKEVGQFSYVISSKTTAAVCGATVTGVVTIPSSVTIDGKNYAVTAISGGTFLDKKDMTSITIPSSVTSIGGSAFYGCTGLTSLTLPSSLTSIGSSAFSGCTDLTSLTLPSSLTSIGSSAFYGCTGLTSLTLPLGVTSISDHVFYGCTGLTSLTLPSSLTSIGSYAFSGCSRLTSLTLPSSLTSIGVCAFYSCLFLRKVINFSQLPISKGSNDYGYVASCANVVYNNCSIEGDFIISTNNEKKTVCDYLGSSSTITLPSVDEIGSYAFYGCSGLTGSLTIPLSVTSIGSYAFNKCSGLTSLTLPSSLTSIGSSAFSGCKLRDIQILATTPPVNNDAFSGQSNYHTTLLVPVGCWDAYAYDDSYWYKFINIKENANTTEELNKTKAYMLKNVDSRSYLAYDPVNDEVAMIELDANVDENEPNHNWQIIEREGQTYIYNLGAKKYLVRRSDTMSPALRSSVVVAASADSWELSEYPTPISMENAENGINIGQSGAWLFVQNEQLRVDQNVTGIESLSVAGSNVAPAYDFFGRKFQNVSKGEINIQQSKKLIKK